MLVLHDLALVLAIGVVVVDILAERSWTIERIQGGNVVEAGRREATHQLAHLVALELEDPDRVAETQHLKDLRIIEGHVVDIDFETMATFDVLERSLDDCEVAQPEKVHLQQTE